MTTKTRNEYIALAGILLLLGFLLYHFVLGGSSSSTVSPTVVSTSAAVSSSTAQGQFLPYGLAFDTKVLQNEAFTALVPLPQFIVEAADLGVTDPFNSPSAAAPAK